MLWVMPNDRAATRPKIARPQSQLYLGQALMLMDSRKRPPSLPSSSASVDDSSKCPCDSMEFIKNWRGNLALGLLEKHKQAVLTVERD